VHECNLFSELVDELIVRQLVNENHCFVVNSLSGTGEYCTLDLLTLDLVE